MPVNTIVNDTHYLADKRGNGILRREVWVDGSGQVTRYNLAYINASMHSGDAGKPIPNESVISFGDPADLLKMLTPARLALMSAVKAQPHSITATAAPSNAT